jgi:hypothetical protein
MIFRQGMVAPFLPSAVRSKKNFELTATGYLTDSINKKKPSASRRMASFCFHTCWFSNNGYPDVN